MAHKDKEPMGLTVEDTADELQLNVQTVRKWLRQGRLPGRKIGKEWRISRQELEDYLRGAEPRQAKQE